MATFTATAAQSTSPAHYLVNGDIVRNVEYTVPGTALSAGDVIQMVRIPAGARINDIIFAISSTSQSHTVTIGDGNDADRFFASTSAVLVEAVRMSLGGGFAYSYSAEDTIDITIGTVTSGTAADADLRLIVSYTMMP